MSNQEKIQKLIEENKVESTLKIDSTDEDSIRALQNVLNSIGFGGELEWPEYGADGIYGQRCTSAVKAFIQKNNLPGNGEVVTKEIAKTMLDREEIVDELRHLHNAAAGNKVERYYYRGSSHAIAVVAVQTLLHELGYDEELKWETYGADGDYGRSTTAAVKAFAEKEGIENDGAIVTGEIAREMLIKFEDYYGPGWLDFEKEESLHITEKVEYGKTRVYVSGGEDTVRLTKFKKGVYTFGQQAVIDFVHNNRSLLTFLRLTDSQINIMVSVSENEGNLNAVNTWDNCFMTFGMFQWTSGRGSDRGELPALLKKIKDVNIPAFEKYFARHGLDIVQTGSISGYFTLNGIKLATPADKTMLRGPEWSFYFWKAGQDPIIQAIEIEHALSRIDRFYKAESCKVGEYYIADLITSEYGLALLLDNHVNRPGYIKGCLKKALKETGLSNPENWGTKEELELIDAYLTIRETYGRSPMTDAAKRAEVTKKHLDEGIISAERHSYTFAG